MRDWLPYRDLFLETIIDLEGPKGLRTCAGCSANWSPWRCMDCLDLPALCTACCLTRHAHDYLHRIKKWTESQVDAGSHREGAGSAFFSGPDSDEEDEDIEDPADVAMVPMADMLNARFESENVGLTFILLQYDCFIVSPLHFLHSSNSISFQLGQTLL